MSIKFIKVVEKAFEVPADLKYTIDSVLIQGDLRAFLKRKGALKPIMAVKFALDIARSVTGWFPQIFTWESY